jgi:mycothiol system anti-sigma-R factor
MPHNDDCFDKIADFLHGELEEKDQSELQEHLERCEQCCEKIEFQQKLGQLLIDRTRKETCPDNVKQRILRNVRALDFLDSSFQKTYRT